MHPILMSIRPLILAAAVSCAMVACSRSGRVEVEHLLNETSFVVLARGEWKTGSELALVVDKPAIAVSRRSVDGAPVPGTVVETLSFPERKDSYSSFVVFYTRRDEQPSILAVVPILNGFLSAVVDQKGDEVSLESFLKMLDSSDGTKPIG